MEQKRTNSKVSQKDKIIMDEEVWDDNFSSKIVKKSFKATVITLNLEGNQNQMFICHNKLIVEQQQMVEEVQKPTN